MSQEEVIMEIMLKMGTSLLSFSMIIALISAISICSIKVKEVIRNNNK